MQPNKVEVRVLVEGRHFTAVFDLDGNPLRIRQRKVHAEGQPYECYYEVPYWSAKHHPLGKGGTMPRKIIAAARRKLEEASGSVRVA